MPRPLRVCSEPNCAELTRDSRCATHRRERLRHLSASRPTTTQRGYGWEHQKAAKDQIAAQPWCTECGQGAHQVGQRGDKLTAHHVLDEDGERVTPTRYTTLCGWCNSSLSGGSQFRARRERGGGAPP
jgi:hypothetical protein